MRMKKLISIILCLSMLITIFPVYGEDIENDLVLGCLECGLSEGHLEDCSQFVSECTCGQEVHIEGCNLFISSEEEKSEIIEIIECTCGLENDEHLETCSLFICKECNGEKDHLEGCSYFENPNSDEDMEDLEDQDNIETPAVPEISDNPIISDILETPETPTIPEISETPSDPVYSISPDTEITPIETVFEKLCNSENLVEFYEILLEMEYYEDILELTTEEINELCIVVENLYNSEEDDIELKEEILETLSVLPNAATEVENPIQTLDYLEWSGTVAGLTLNKDVVLVGDTYMTSKITIPKSTTVTIDLNGYMLHGSGEGSIIDNNGTLTIIDSRPNSGSHRFTKVANGPWVLDENGEYEVIGGLITGGRDKTAMSAGASGGGAVKQGSNVRSNILIIEGGTFIGNSSTRAGGAIYGGAVTMNDGLIIGNYAEGFGAGISLSGSFTMNGGEIRENNTNPNSSYNKAGTKSYDCASVIIGYSSDFLMTGGKLIGVLSTVKTDANGPTFIMTGGEVIGDFRILNGLNATLSGGEINGSVYMLSGSCSVSGSQLIHGGNRDIGGSVYIKSGDFDMSGGTIRDSFAEDGGGIYIDGGNFTMSGGTIKNCFAENNGGGIYVSGGNIDIYDGNIKNNEAENNGGGIYVNTDSVDVTINVYDGEISNNTAGNHAGAIGANAEGNYSIALNIGEELCNGVYTEEHSDNSCPIISDNTALRFGGAFCLHGASDKLSVNIYCGNIEDNSAIRNYGSDTLKQNGGSVIVYGGEIDAGIMVGGGSYTDTRIDAEQVYFNLWSNYDGGPAEATVIDVTRGVTFVFPSDTYEWEGHVLSGWSNQADTKGFYVPVQGEYVVDEETEEYSDFYAVWDAQTSYVVYIPAELEINSDTFTGDFEVSADINYFKKDSVLDIYLESDFKLVGSETSKKLSYSITQNEGGILKELESGDIIASYKYNYQEKQYFLIELLDFVRENDTYLGSVTFRIDYYEEVDDYSVLRL